MEKSKNTKYFHKPFYSYNLPRLFPQFTTRFTRLKQNKWKSPKPDNYKKVARVLAAIASHKVDLKSIFDPHNMFSKDLYQLALITINHTKEIDFLLEKFDILRNNECVDRWIARVLVSEMLWGKQILRLNSAPARAMKQYEEDLRESFVEMMTFFPNPENANVATELPVYVRINTLLISVEKAIRAFTIEGGKLVPRCNTYSEHLKVLSELSGTSFMRDYHIPDLFIFPPGASFYNHSAYLKGILILQDKGSCLSSFLLDPEPGSIVLDMCAAPGIKTNHVANIMKNKGLIYAYDINAQRSAYMHSMMELTNVKCTTQIQDNYLNFQRQDVNYILVDPPSTQSGIFFNTSKDGQAFRVQYLKSNLSKALRFSLQNFPKIKRIVFTVCSIFADECEEVVDDALKQVGNSYTLMDLKEKFGNEWMNFGSSQYTFANKCIRTVPKVDLCQGHFIAVFERNFDVPIPPYENRSILMLKKKNPFEVKPSDFIYFDEKEIDFSDDIQL